MPFKGINTEVTELIQIVIILSAFLFFKTQTTF